MTLFNFPAKQKTRKRMVFLWLPCCIELYNGDKSIRWLESVHVSEQAGERPGLFIVITTISFGLLYLYLVVTGNKFNIFFINCVYFLNFICNILDR